MRRRIRDLARSGLSLVMALMICVSLLPAEAFAREYGGALDSDDAIAEESTARQAGGKFRVAVRSAAPKAAASGAFDWSDDTEMRAKAIWERMSDDEKIGQLFLIQTGNSAAPLANSVDKIKGWVKDYHPAGLVLFEEDFGSSDGPDSFREKLAGIQEQSRLGLIISADEEGGNVLRASKHAQYEHEKFKGPQELKAEAEASGTDALAAVEKDAADKAAFLKSLGVNLNFAPVADVATEETAFMYRRGRSWGGSAAETADYVAAAVRGMEGGGLGTAIKHFPGYGESTGDTHKGQVLIDTSKDALMSNDILPFSAGIGAGNSMVMVTHNVYNKINGKNYQGYPASLSPDIYGILRGDNDMSFGGVIVTDSLAMAAVKDYGRNAALMALQAGADLAMVGDTGMIDTVRSAVQDGSFTMEDVKTRVLRVLCWKIEHGILDIRDEIDIKPDDEAVYSLPGGAARAAGSFDEMWAMASEDGGTVTLLKDVTAEGNTPDGKRVCSKTITLDLNGKTLSHTGESQEFFKVVKGGKFTVDDKNHKASVTEAEKVPVSEVGDASYDAENRTVTYYVPDADQENMAIKYVVDASRCGSIVVNGESSSLVNPSGRSFGPPVIDVADGGVLDMKGGNLISLDTGEDYGIRSNFGTVNMSGGQILGFWTGLVLVGSHVGVSPTLDGGIIAGCRGAGVQVEESAFTMRGGVIAANGLLPRGRDYGAGIRTWSPKEMKIEGGVITGNKATQGGGGIYIIGRKTIDSRTISGGTICFNEAPYGAGIYHGWRQGENGFGGKLSITGGRITHNTATESGGGLYFVNDDGDRTSVSVSGDAYIYDNSILTDGTAKADNVALKNGAVLTVTGALGEAAKIGVTGSELQRLVVKSGSGYTMSRDEASRFEINNSGVTVVFDETAGSILLNRISEDVEASFAPADGGDMKTGSFDDMWMLASESGGTVTLLDDVTATGDIICSNKITLDLDGHTLTHAGRSEEFFKVVEGGVFTIEDKNHNVVYEPTDKIPIGEVGDASYDAENRTVTYYVPDGEDDTMAVKYVVSLGKDGDERRCGAILVNGENSVLSSSRDLGAAAIDVEYGGTLNIAGGSIISASQKCHGVRSWQASSVNMSGGQILGFENGMYLHWTTTDNKPNTLTGGLIAGNQRGICLSNTHFTMSGGVIAANVNETDHSHGPAGAGGGIYTWHPATMNIKGGTITGNKAKNSGGGIFICGIDNQNSRVISGGTVCFNKAAYGGGIYHGYSPDGEYKDNFGGKLAITGGRIIYNTATESGGGLYVMNDDGDRTSVSVSGGAYIYDNSVLTDSTAKADNVALKNGAVLTVTGALSESAKIGVTGNELQRLVAVPSDEHVITKDDEERFCADDPDSYSCMLAGDKIYLFPAGTEVREITLHDVLAGYGESPDTDSASTAYVLSGETFGSIDMKLEGSESFDPVHVQDCIWYKDQARSEAIAEGTPVDDLTDVYTYRYEATFRSGNGTKTLARRDGSKLGESVLEDISTGLSKCSFLDGEDEIPFASLLTMTRSYGFVNVKIDDSAAGGGADLDTYALAGRDYDFELPIRDGVKWKFEGISDDDIARRFTDESKKDTETVTLKNVGYPVSVSSEALRTQTSINVYVMLGGDPLNVGTVSTIHGQTLFGDIDGAGAVERVYVRAEDLSEMLAPYGFDADKYDGGLVFANSNGRSDKIYADARPDRGPDGWRIPIALSQSQQNGMWSYDNCRLYYLANGMKDADISADGQVDVADTEKFRFRMISVNDYAGAQAGDDVTSVNIVPDGGSITLQLPHRDGNDWVINDLDIIERDKTAVVARVDDTAKNETVITLSEVRTSIVIECGMSEDFKYTVQYYAWCENIRMFTSDEFTLDDNEKLTSHIDGVQAVVPVIDTSLTGLPSNEKTNNTSGAIRYIGITDEHVKENLDDDGNIINNYGSKGKVATTFELQSIYADRNYSYKTAPTLLHCDRLYSDPNYSLGELWILREGQDPKVEANWNVIKRLSDKDDSSEEDSGRNVTYMDVDDLRKEVFLTSNQRYFDLHSDNTVLLHDGATVRFVYTRTESEDAKDSKTTKVSDIHFYDYSIMNGTEKGINDPKNYPDGAKANKMFRFGNSTLSKPSDTATFDGGYFFNQRNSVKRPGGIKWNDRVDRTLYGCAFELAKELNDGQIVYYDNAGEKIYVPNLFNDGDAIGKTYVNGYSLQFSRNGDNYQLSKVLKDGGTQTVLNELETLHYVTNGSGERTHDRPSWSNNFWPMDSVDTDYAADQKSMPLGDDGNLHNYFFGMNFDITFKLSSDYTGPLDYCFFGDDDMWVFLDGKLILDIGGVHTSVGEYVDLRKYVDMGDTREHTLSVFYIERGGVGSTCWMRFTIPDATFVDGEQFEPDEFGNLAFSKAVLNAGEDVDDEYEFTVELTPGSDSGESEIRSNFSYVITRRDLSEVTGLLTPEKDDAGSDLANIAYGKGTLMLRAGDSVKILNIPVGTEYRITEAGSPEYTAFITSAGNTCAGSEATGSIQESGNERIEFQNDYSIKGIELPRTGGTGTAPFMACGAAIAVAGFAALLHGRKRRRT